jgi:fibronectin-binding autotransporter adhesin
MRADRCLIRSLTTIIKMSLKVRSFLGGFIPMVRRCRSLIVAVACVAASSMQQALAVDYTWNVAAGGTQSWTTAANWLPSTGAPTTADDTANLGINLSGDLTVDLGVSDVTLGGLTLGGTTVAVTTNVSSSGGRLLLNSTAANATLTSGGVSGAINRTSATVLLDDTVDISNTSTQNLVLAGNLGQVNGNRTLTNLATGSVQVTIGSGTASTIQFYDANAPTTARNLIINGTDGSTTIINALFDRNATSGNINFGENIRAPLAVFRLNVDQSSFTGSVELNRQQYVLGANAATGLGALTFATNNQNIWGGEIQSNDDARVWSNQRITVGNGFAFTGSNSLTVAGVLTTRSNRAIGNTLIAGKTLTLAGSGTIPAIAISERASDGSRTFVIDGPGRTVITGQVTNNLESDGNPSIIGTFRKRGSGRTELLNGTNTINGPIESNGGLLVFGTAGSWGVTTGINAADSGGISYAPGVSGSGFSDFALKLNPASVGFLALTSADSNANLDFSPTGSLGTAPSLSVASDGDMTFTGVVTAGTAGYNWGGVSGTLTLNALASVGANPVTYKNGGTVIVTGPQSYSGVTTVRGAVMATSEGLISTRAGTTTTTANINVPSTLVVSSVANGGVNSSLGSSSSDAANLVLSMATLRYTASTASSTDRLFTIGAAGATLESTGAGAVTFGSAGGANALSGTGARALTLGGGGNGRNTVASLLANGADPVNDVLAVTKADAGTWVLSGGNTYTGSTTVSAGTLFINGDQSLATGAVSVASGATLGGNGTVGGLTTLASGATLSPGASPGNLTFSQSLSFTSGANYNWQMLSATGTAGATNAWDLVTVSGSLSVDSTSVDPFNINLWTLSGTGPDVSGNAANFNSSQDYTWTIATASGGIAGFDATKFRITTSATNGTGGFSNSFGSGTFSIAQNGNDLNLVFTRGAAPSVITINVASGTQTQTQAGYPLLTGVTPVVKTGAGTLVVDQVNTLTGSTTVQAGRLQLANGSALGSSEVIPVAGGTVSLAPYLQTTVGGLAPNAGGLVDLGNGLVTVASGLTPTELVTAILAGRGDGSWTGTTGITSSVAASDLASGVPRAVGWLDNGDGSLTTAFAAPGDTNLDWVVDVLDAGNFLTFGKYDTGLPATWLEGDFNYDGVVDVLDASEFFGTGLYDTGNYNTPAGMAGAVAAVPEPSTWAVLAAAGLTLLATRRRAN